jgi:hypothetical protein
MPGWITRTPWQGLGPPGLSDDQTAHHAGIDFAGYFARTVLTGFVRATPLSYHSHTLRFHSSGRGEETWGYGVVFAWAGGVALIPLNAAILFRPEFASSFPVSMGRDEHICEGLSPLMAG